MSKEYLGDSVYAQIEGGMIKLSTENGLPTDPSNVIYLEPSVFIALCFFGKKHFNITENQTSQ